MQKNFITTAFDMLIFAIIYKIEKKTLSIKNIYVT